MLDLVQLELEQRGPFFSTGFWRAIANRLPEEYHKQPDPRFKPRVMTDEQACKFEDEVVKFGKYSGQTRRDIPLRYLEFIADSGLNMAAYLRSDRGAARYAAENQSEDEP